MKLILKKKLDNKRFFRTVRSKLKRKLRFRGHIRLVQAKKYNLLNYEHTYPKLFKVKKVLAIKIPKIFCLMQDHSETLQFLTDVDGKLKNQRVSNLFIDHSENEFIGLSASYLFDNKIKKYLDEHRKLGFRISLIGRFSNSISVNNFLVAFGLPNELDVKENYTKSSVDNDYATKYLTYKKSGSIKNGEAKGVASIGLAKYFDKCFNHNGFYIKNNAIDNISYAVSEIIGNAEEHAEESAKEWKVLGFYDKSSSICSFAIVNFGQTVYESLSSKKSTSREVLQKVEDVINKQKSMASKSKAFLSNYNEETIWNVMALQDGISSKRPESGRGSSRGQGLSEVISFIDQIRSEGDSTEIDFISGHSKIRIDFEYPILKEIIGGKPVRKIIFNKERDLFKLQDTNKVISMMENFPGTIITGRFTISDKFKNEKMKKNENE